MAARHTPMAGVRKMAKGRNRGTGTVSVRRALWGFERHARRRQCWLMDGRAVAGRAWRDGRGGWIIAAPAARTGDVVARGVDSDHELSNPIAWVSVDGRVRGVVPRSNVSMMNMRPPQHGQRSECTKSSGIGGEWLTVG